MSSSPAEGESVLEAVSGWTPGPIAQLEEAAPRTGTVDFAKARGVAIAPLVVLGLIQLLFLTLRYAPETRSQGWLVEVAGHLYPLAANDVGVFTTDAWEPWPTTGLVASFALAAAAHHRTRLVRPVTFGLAGVIVASMLATLLPIVDTGDLWWASAGLLAVVISGAALRAPALLFMSGNPRPDQLRPRFGWVIAFALLVYPPIAVGRMLYGDGIHRRLLRRGTEDVFAMADLHVWYWIVGVCIAVALWSAIQMIPPYRGREVLVPALALVVSVVAIQVLRPYTMEATDMLRNLLRA